MEALENQVVAHDLVDTGRFYNDASFLVAKGSGMGLTASGEFSDAALLTKELAILPSAPRAGVKAYFRFKDDILIFRGVSRQQHDAMFGELQRLSGFFKLSLHMGNFTKVPMLDLWTQLGGSWHRSGHPEI